MEWRRGSGGGQLHKLRQEYDEHFQSVDAPKKQGVTVAILQQTLPKVIDQFEEDTVFLDSGFKEASEHFEKKFWLPNCPKETLKEAN